jgi:hypothetical protein
MKVIEFTQFVKVDGMKWNDFVKMKKEEEEMPTLITDDGKYCLWKEKVKILDVDENQTPPWGDVWYKKGKNGELVIHKANYDSSD